MDITLIAAMGQNRVIGYQDDMPWHMPNDLKFFQQNTLHKPVIMGRKTYQTVNQPLPKRRNIIVTRQSDLLIPGCDVVNSIEAGFDLCGNVAEIMICGGAEIYKLAMPRATKMLLTFIEHEFVGDTFFPEWDPTAWQEVNRIAHASDEKNPYPYSFVTFEKIRADN